MSALVQLVCLSLVAALQVSAAIRVSRSWIDLNPIPYFPSVPHSDQVFRSLMNARNERLKGEEGLERSLVGAYFNTLGKYGKKPVGLTDPPTLSGEQASASVSSPNRRPQPSRVIIRDLTSNKIRTQNELPNPYGNSKSAKALCGMMKLC
ncbi:hypothetical protein L596_022870 [Steinernema carpocapsae]|uniref:Uncharacterized protein n=1 Tax=Steinernema carpocapsae TaxID=34508 RepID=A0A4U5MBS3_STECR|nr:hypothetical protein L596_022870 [Steinernema carpocapsae]